jgi:diacylglycerol O-acyltransferase
VGISDPIKRATAVRQMMEGMKKANQAGAVDTVFQMFNLAPVPLIAMAAGMPQTSNTLLNLVCTNVPGPMIPLYCAGQRMLAHYPLVPISWDLGLAVGITSYDQKLYFGLMADTKVVPDVQRFKEFVDESLVELRTAAGVTPTDLPAVIGGLAMGMPPAPEPPRARAAAEVQSPATADVQSPAVTT